MSQILKNPKLRFLFVIGAVPILLVAATMAALSLDFSLSSVGIPLLLYWGFSLWFILSACARKNAQLTKAELFTLGFWITLAIFLTVAVVSFALPSFFFMGV